jgi:hypothetical protein
LSPNTDYGFARTVNLAPLAFSEFVPAARHYPIFFVQNPAGGFQPVALLGLRQGENQFVDDAGRWTKSYVPAFVRRYPFILGQDGTVFIDEACSRLATAGPGDALFGADGENTPALDRSVALLSQYRQEMELSEAFARRMSELGILKAWGLQVVCGDEQIVLDGLSIIDAKLFQELAEPAVVEAFRSGHLALAYAHLASLGNVTILTELAERRVPRGAAA